MAVSVNGDGQLNWVATLDDSQISAKLDQLEQKILNSGKASDIASQQQIKSINSLKIQLQSYQAIADKATDPKQLMEYNLRVQQLEAEIGRLGNVGKQGFDQLGNAIPVEPVSKFGAAISRVTDLGNIGGRMVTQLSRQLIGLGTGFLSFYVGAKAIETIISYVQGLDMFTGRLDQLKHNMEAFNEVNANANKEAGQQITTLKILYQTATDVTQSYQDRIAAAQELKKEFPSEFANANNLAIINGKLKGSYDDLTLSILATARAKAASNKIADLAAKELDIDFQVQKINNARSNELGRVDGATSGWSAGTGGAGGVTSEELQRKNINVRADNAIKIQEQNKQIIQGQIDFLTQYVGGSQKLAAQIEGTNKLIKDPLKNFDTIVKNASDKADLANLRAALQAKMEALAPNDNQIKVYQDRISKVDELLKAYSASKFEKTDPSIAAGQSLLASETSELQKIDSLKDKYATNDKTRNEQERDAILATFKQQENAINALNTKYDQYVAKYGVAAAKRAGLQRIDPNTLKPIETAAYAGLAGQQSLEATEKTIDQQKIIFQEYEDYKLKAGTDAANKLYANELKGFKSYVDYLKSLQPSEAELNSADPYVKARASKLKDYLDVALPQAYNEELKAGEKHLNDLLTQNVDYEQKRQAIIDKSNSDIAVLMQQGYVQQADQLKQATQDQLTQLEVQQFETQSIYSNLFQHLSEMSASYAAGEIERAKADAKAKLQAGTLTLQAYDKIIKALAKIKQTNDDVKFDNWLDVGKSIGQIARDFESVNSGFASYLSGLGQAISAVGNLGKAYDKLQSDQAQGLDTTQDYVNIAAQGIDGIIGLIGTLTSAAQERKKAETDYYNSVIDFQKQYNIALDEQIRLQYQTQGNLFYTDTAKEITDAAKAYDAATKQYQDSLQKLQQGQAIVGQKNAVDGKSVASAAGSGALAGAAIGTLVGGPIGTVIGGAAGGVVGAIAGIFGGKKKADVLRPLLETYPQLIDADGKFNEALAKSLLGANQVTDATKKLLQNTVDYYDEEQKALDQITSALTDMVGQLGTNISDSLVQAFENGTDAAKAFSTAVSGILGNIVKQDLFQAIFGNQLTSLSQKLNADALAGGDVTNSIISDLESFFKGSSSLVGTYEQALSAAELAGKNQGLDLFPSSNSTASTTTLSGGIQASITEDTASILAGTMKGIQLNTLQTNDKLDTQILYMSQYLSIAQDNLSMALKIEANTRRTADNTDGISDTLKQIAKNTGDSAALSLRAAGKYGY